MYFCSRKIYGYKISDNRNAKKYNPARLAEKVAYMQRHNFQNKEISIKGLSMDDMVPV